MANKGTLLAICATTAIIFAVVAHMAHSASSRKRIHDEVMTFAELVYNKHLENVTFQETDPLTKVKWIKDLIHDDVEEMICSLDRESRIKVRHDVEELLYNLTQKK